MKSIITEIFNGRRGHIDTMRIPNRETSLASIKAEKEFINKLSPELFELYEKYTDIGISNDMEEINFFFKEGFKLGLLVGLECTEE